MSTSFKASFFSKKKPWLVAGERALRRRSQGPANVEGGEGLSDFAIPKMARGQDRRPRITNLAATLLRFLNQKDIRVRPRISNQGFDSIDSGARMGDRTSLSQISETGSVTDRYSHGLF